MENKRMDIRFGVLGGGSVDQGSGADILRSIQNIVGQIEKRGITKLKFSVDTSGLNQINQQVNKVTNTANAKVKAISQTTTARINSSYGTMKNTIGELNKANRGTTELTSAFNKLTAAKQRFDANPSSKTADEYRAQQVAVSDLTSAIKKKISVEQQGNNFVWNAKKIALRKSEQSERQVNNFDWNANKNILNNEQIQNNLEWFGLKKLHAELEANNKEWARMEALALRTEKEVNNFDWNAKKQILHAAEQKDKETINSELQYYKILSQANHYYDKFAKNIQKTPTLNNEWAKIKERLSVGNFDSLPQARNELEKLRKLTYDVGAESETTAQKIERLFGAHLSTAVAMVGVHLLQQSLSQIYTTVVDLDKALVNLQVATGYTRGETSELLSTYSQMGKEIGATTLQVAEAANEWLRQGYSIADSNILIKDSMMLSKLGQMSSAEATTALTSAMKGYKLSVQDVVGIVDKFTSVDMSAAVSAGYIATALSETATSARLAGIDINKVTGYIASIGEVTQDGAETIGNSLKTIFARMGNIKQGILIDPESGDILSNTESALEGVGIKLRINEKEFRNFGEVLDEVAGKWGGYSSVQQRAIAVAFAGTRQQEKFLTLMEHYDDAMKYSEIATNSAGTALDKYNKTYLKGVEAAQDRAKASFENLSTTILNSDIVAGGFNIGAGILGFLNSILSLGDGAIIKIGLVAGALYLLGKAFTAIKTLSTGRPNRRFHNMPVNEPMVTWNELAA